MKKFNIKYIENNLVFNQAGECFAYYELIPYNYAFLSTDEKFRLHGAMQRIVAQSREGKLHILQISTEESIRHMQELSKREIRGDKKSIDSMKGYIDRTTECIIEDINDNNAEMVESDTEEALKENMTDYRFYIGIKLMESDNEMSLEKYKDTLLNWFYDFLSDFSHEFMGDFVSVRNKEVEHFKRLEKLQFQRLSDNFKVRRALEKDFGYIIERIYGKNGVAYDDYNYYLPHIRLKEKSMVKMHDILKLTDVMIEENARYLHLISEKEDNYAAYFTINEVVSDLEFPSSELLYYQQEFDFPIDTSINVEIVPNKKALTTVRNKKKELNDLDNHAYMSGNETSDNVSNALEDVNELESELGRTKDSMYKMSYILRITAPDKEELKMRCASVRDYYDGEGIKLVRPFGNMLKLHEEFIPAAPRSMNDYVQYVTSDFLAGLGFGATQTIGERYGIYLGNCPRTGRSVYIRPWLASQGVENSVTNSLSVVFTGSLGGGKSMACKNILYHVVRFGGRVLQIDPKGECGHFKEALPEIADKINIVNLTFDEENRGILDPYVIMPTVRESENLAKDILMYLLKIESSDSGKYPALCKALKKVSESEKKGLLCVVEELKKQGKEESIDLAEHIESFADDSFAKLLFSDGTVEKTIDINNQWNIIQVQNLILPDKDTPPESYSETEKLSIAMMITISTFSLNFIKSDRETFKVVNIDEAWAILNVAQGKALSNKLVRAGRSMNAGVYFCTQNTDDMQDEKIKNNIGMKFAFRSTDIVEIKKTLSFMGLDEEDEYNQETLRSLGNGECLFCDIYGRVAKIRFIIIFNHIFNAFDTRPPQQLQEE